MNTEEEEGRQTARRLMRGQGISYCQMLQRECLAIARLGMNEYDHGYYDELSKIALRLAEGGYLSHDR